MKSKRGSLELSVNAIVVIVLAITMLGIGIFFTRSMLGNIEVPIPKPDVTATSAQPIVMSNTNLELPLSKKSNFIIGYYNKLGETVKKNNSMGYQNTPRIVCNIPSVTTPIALNTSSGLGILVDSGNSVEYTVMIEKLNTIKLPPANTSNAFLPGEVYACELQIYDSTCTGIPTGCPEPKLMESQGIIITVKG